MAFLLQDEEKKREEEGLAQQTQGGGIIGGESAGVGQGAKQGGTGFATLQKYLTANAPQAGALAEKVAGKATSAAEEAKTQLAGGQTQLASQLQPYGTLDASSLEKKYITPILQPQVQTASRFPILGLRRGPQAGQSEFQQALSGQYKGPQDITGIEGFSKAQESAAKASALSGLLGQEAGRAQMLRESATRPYASQGRVNLDQALLQTSPQAREILAKTAEQIKGMPDVTAATEAGTKQISEAKQKTADTASQLAAKLSQAKSGLGGEIQGLSQYTQDPNAYYQDFLSKALPGGAKDPLAVQMLLDKMIAQKGGLGAQDQTALLRNFEDEAKKQGLMSYGVGHGIASDKGTQFIIDLMNKYKQEQAQMQGRSTQQKQKEAQIAALGRLGG